MRRCVTSCASVCKNHQMVRCIHMYVSVRILFVDAG